MSKEAMFPVFAELVGALALRELALDLEIEKELGRRGFVLTEADIEQERSRLADSFGVDELGQLVAREVLDSRQLGPHRLAKLLSRNAGLRKLIDPAEEPSDEAIRIAHAVRFGPKRRVRIALLGSAQDAASARAAIAQARDASGISAAFAEVAAARSLDATAATGGLLGDVSTADPGLSDVLRREIARATPGTVGDIVALDTGFALVLVEADIPAEEVSVGDVRDELRATIRDRAERLAMEALANDLIDQAGISPLAPGLRWSWQRVDRGAASR